MPTGLAAPRTPPAVRPRPRPGGPGPPRRAGPPGPGPQRAGPRVGQQRRLVADLAEVAAGGTEDGQLGPVADRHHQQHPAVHVHDGLADPPGGQALGRADGEAGQPAGDRRELVGPVDRQAVGGRQGQPVDRDREGVGDVGHPARERGQQPVEVAVGVVRRLRGDTHRAPQVRQVPSLFLVRRAAAARPLARPESRARTVSGSGGWLPSPPAPRSPPPDSSRSPGRRRGRPRSLAGAGAGGAEIGAAGCGSTGRARGSTGPAPSPGAGAGVRVVVGSVTSAAVPPPGALRSSTSIRYRAANRATTSRPMVPASSAVSMVGRDSRAFSSATSAGCIPMPSSKTVRLTPSTARRADTRTRLAGGEYVVAFSSSSASRWIRSRTTWAAIPTSATPTASTRS